MRYLKQFLVFPGLILSALIAHAQQGPELPCPSCQQEYVKPTPYEGSWFNPEQSGSGFLFEVENDRLLGYYFGYDNQGEPLWTIFTGQLQDASDQGTLWKVTAPMDKYTGGNCINCAYKPPANYESIAEIEVVFNRHGHATFSIDGGEVQNIVPMYFGFQTIDHFAEQTSFPIPELEGWWTIFVDENLEIPDVYTFTNYLVYIGPGSINSVDNSLNFSSVAFTNGIEMVSAGTINCAIESNFENSELVCAYPIAWISKAFNINMADMTSDRIYGESNEGDTLEMIRVSSDVCIFPEKPEKCLNTNVFGYLED